MMGIPYDAKKPYKKLHECHECGEKFKPGETIKSGAVQKLKIYDNPWATEPSTVKVHTHNDDGRHGSCLDKLTDTSWADFRYFYCFACGRLIISQCPYNGWRSYIHEEHGEEICVACYQQETLTNGMAKDVLESGRVPGDFFEDDEIANHGWALVQGYDNIRIAGSGQAKAFCDTALSFIAKGMKVLINYESMGIGGGEGYVSLYQRLREEKINDQHPHR